VSVNRAIFNEQQKDIANKSYHGQRIKIIAVSKDSSEKCRVDRKERRESCKTN